MTAKHSCYRTLIFGTLVQQTGLSVGGIVSADGLDTCHRDGQGRLTISGSSLAGQLIETAARILPNLVSSDDSHRTLKRQISAKERTLPGKRRDQEDERFRQSVWRFAHAHPLADGGKPATEWRQGVGIRQATGASAIQKRALYDFEFVPAGAEWSFSLDIDTHRSPEGAEAIAVLALAEWARGFGWLGRGAARGTGWFILDPATTTLLRLPKTPEMIEMWPDNSWDGNNGGNCAEWKQGVRRLVDKLTNGGAAPIPWESAVNQAAKLAEEREASESCWLRGDWHYLSFDVHVTPGVADNGYGYDVLQVGGHPSLGFGSQQNDPLPPLSVDPRYAGEPGTQQSNQELAHWRIVNDEFKKPDAPFVVTKPLAAGEQPYLPGGGLRGPLRHTASRLARARSCPIRDPNWTEDPLADQLKKTWKARHQVAGFVRDPEVRALCDCVANLFGAEELCGRVLISDAMLEGNEVQLARVDHHAEDEFTAGVYGGGKFDCNVLIRGEFKFRVVVEASTRDDLWRLIDPLLPALDLAAIGHVPMGGGKWRGAGWLKWSISNIKLRRAGDQCSIASGTGVTQQAPSQSLSALREHSQSLASPRNGQPGNHAVQGLRDD